MSLYVVNPRSHFSVPLDADGKHCELDDAESTRLCNPTDVVELNGNLAQTKYLAKAGVVASLKAKSAGPEAQEEAAEAYHKSASKLFDKEFNPSSQAKGQLGKDGMAKVVRRAYGGVGIAGQGELAPSQKRAEQG